MDGRCRSLEVVYLFRKVENYQIRAGPSIKLIAFSARQAAATLLSTRLLDGFTCRAVSNKQAIAPANEVSGFCLELPDLC
jgi:hypothetical protein